MKKYLPHAVICDVDGTVAVRGDRGAYDYSSVHLDLPNKPIIEVVHRLVGDHREIIFVSGREDSCYDQTCAWLQKHLGICFSEAVTLYMRKTGDYRKDASVKREIYEKYIEDNYQVDYVLDDRTQVVEMWRSLGLVCLQVANGDF